MITTKMGINMKIKSSIANTANPNTVASRLRNICAKLLVQLLLLLTLPTVVQAQFNFTTNNNGTITITGYIGSGGAVTIPDTINGLPVTSIGDYAFFGNSLTSITIPNGIISIGVSAFDNCFNLTSVVLQ